MAPRRVVDTTPFTGDFPLRKVAGLLPNYAPPAPGTFAQAGEWEQAYGMYLLTGAPLRVGTVSGKRTPASSDRFGLDVLVQRRAQSGYSHFQKATMKCQANALASPVSWECESKMATGPAKAAYLQTGRTRTASIVDGILVLQDKIRTHRIAFAGEYSNEWSLLEAVQRLSGELLKPMAHTLIDEYDTPQAGHTLSYRGKEQVACHMGALSLASYVDIGAC